MVSRAYEKNIQNPSVSGHVHIYRNIVTIGTYTVRGRKCIKKNLI